MGLVLMLLLPVTSRAAEVRLSVWVDVSGSLAAGEFDRVRTILGSPLALLERLPAREISLTVFWDPKSSALFGASGVWRLPELVAPPACDDRRQCISLPHVGQVRPRVPAARAE